MVVFEIENDSDMDAIQNEMAKMTGGRSVSDLAYLLTLINNYLLYISFKKIRFHEYLLVANLLVVVTKWSSINPMENWLN